MNLQAFRNVTTILKIVGDKPEMPNEAKVDIEEVSNFFGNIISDIDKELAKTEEVKKDKKAGRLFVYPLRLEI